MTNLPQNQQQQSTEPYGTPQQPPRHRVGDYTTDMIEDTATKEAGKAVKRLFNWLRKRLGMKKGASSDPS